MKLNFIKRFDKSTLLAFLCALLCAICVAAFMLQIKGEARANEQEIMNKYGGEQVEVCVCTRNISGGETIRDSDIEVRQWVSALLPENAILKKSDCVGKVLGSSVLKGEVFSKNRFEAATSSINVPSGYSALSVPLDEVSAVGGSITTNQTVDLYATGSSTTTRIASDVLILETSSSKNSNASDTKWATLAIESSKVQEIVSAAQNLELYLVLPGRNSDK